MSENEWLENLKPGDEVIIETGYSCTSLSAGTVDRVTKTQVIVGSRRFGRACGWLVGRGNRTPVRLVQPTQECLNRLLRQDALSLVKTTNWERLPQETLLMIHGLLTVPEQGASNAN